jgi:hypothetical protein
MKTFLTSAHDEGERSASRSCRFTPEEIAPDALWIGGLLGPRVGLDAVKKRNILPLPGKEPGPSSPLRVAVPTELSGLPIICK